MRCMRQGSYLNIEIRLALLHVNLDPHSMDKKLKRMTIEEKKKFLKELVQKATEDTYGSV